MDDGVGRLLQCLDAQDRLENTLVFFTSDNGMSMGHHGIWGKGNGTFPQNMYDTAVKVPFVAAGPGLAQGLTTDALLSHIDIRPTILDLLGIPDPEADDLPGHSFVPLLQGKGNAERDCVVVFDEYGPVRMVRTREWKYVHRYPYGPHELYHLANDPDEKENLYGTPGSNREAARLKRLLDGWYEQWSAPEMDGTRHPVTGKGQVERVGPQGHGSPAFETDLEYLHPEKAPAPPPGSKKPTS